MAHQEMARLGLLLLLGLSSALARPDYWVQRYATTDCSLAGAGPTPGSTVVYGLHAPPAVDTATGTSFVVKDAATGAVATNICPGKTYQVQVTYSALRCALLWASTGTFSPATETACPNRQVQPGSASTFTSNITIACAATGTWTVASTSAMGAVSPHLRATTALPITPACKAASCPQPRAMPPPPKRRAPKKRAPKKRVPKRNKKKARGTR